MYEMNEICQNNEQIDFFHLCSKAFLILNGKSPMNVNIWWDLFNLKLIKINEKASNWMKRLIKA